jgi:hypothetical protein
MKNLAVLGLVVTILSSCNATTKITNTDTNEIRLYESGVFTRPLVADVVVGDKREQIEYIVPDYMSVKKSGKQNALLAFKKEHNCEYVVDPVYKIITITGKGSEVKIILNGYPVSYSNIHEVDTLPASIVQYRSVLKESDDYEFINYIEENEPTMGLEFSVFAYKGVQFDAKLSNFNSRFYVAGEMSYNVQNDISFDFVDKSNDVVMGGLSNINLDAYTTISGGLMKEVKMTRFLKLRGIGGVNIGRSTFRLSSYGLNTINGYDINTNTVENFNVTSIGLRGGAGLDFKLYKSLSLIGKIHVNLNILNVVSKPSLDFENPSNQLVTDFKIKDVSITHEQTINTSFGLRFVF